jgi:Protein of unknown function (DUF3800)
MVAIVASASPAVAQTSGGGNGFGLGDDQSASGELLPNGDGAQVGAEFQAVSSSGGGDRGSNWSGGGGSPVITCRLTGSFGGFPTDLPSGRLRRPSAGVQPLSARAVPAAWAQSHGPVRSAPVTLLFHCDESYDRRFHLHLGVLSTGAQAAAAERSVRRLLRQVRRELDVSVKELHGQPLLDQKGPWASVDLDACIDVCHRSLEIIVDHELEVLYRGINVAKYRRKYTASTDPRRDAFKFVFEDLLTMHLLRRCEARGEYALVVTDRQHQYADALRYAHAGGRTSQESADNGFGIIDTCHFVDSAHSPLVQLADVAAYIQRRRLTIPTERDVRAEKAMAELSGIVSDAVPDPKGWYCSVHRHFS